MTDFLDKAYDHLRLKEQGAREAQREFEMVFDAISELQGVHAKAYLDLDNLEIVFGAIEMGTLIKKLGKRTDEEIIELRNAFVTVIYKTLEFNIRFPVGGGGTRIHPPAPYNDFVSRLGTIKAGVKPQDPVEYSFITFNYDLCLDYALHFHRFGYDYCLTGAKGSGRSPLLKLHGSINWGVADDGEIVPKYVSEARFDLYPGLDHVFYNLGSTLHLKEHKGSKLNGPPVIVPPTWNKNSYHGQLSNVWAVAAEELSEAENIFIIGYSLPETDSFFRYLYALGSESKKRLRNFVVINPDDSGVTKERFLQMVGRGVEGRFTYIPKTFNNALADIERYIRTP